jgi:hypothetical protein
MCERKGRNMYNKITWQRKFAIKKKKEERKNNIKNNENMVQKTQINK